MMMKSKLRLRLELREDVALLKILFNEIEFERLIFNADYYSLKYISFYKTYGLFGLSASEKHCIRNKALWGGLLRSCHLINFRNFYRL